MPKHDYTAGEALDLLMKNVESESSYLAECMQRALDTGQETQDSDNDASSKRGRKKSAPRYYRKYSAYSDKEALSVAINVLNAHLVEIRLFANSASEAFADAAIDGPTQADAEKAKSEQVDVTTVGKLKELQIELAPETVRGSTGQENAPLPTADSQQLKDLQDILEQLAVLLDSTEA